MPDKLIKQKDIQHRNHLSKNKFNELNNAFFLTSIMFIFSIKNSIDKPVGFWYSLNWYWIENLNIGMRYTDINYEKNDDSVYNIYDKYLYKVEIKENSYTNIEYNGLDKILVLDEYKDFKIFYNKYKLDIQSFRQEIDWKKFYGDYGGIEIRNIHSNKFSIKKKTKWWYGWDVPSGWIWNKDLMSNFKLIL